MKGSLKLLLLLGLFSPLVVNAATVSLDCPSTAKAGSDVTCSIKITSSEEVGGFQSNISASSGLTYKSYTKASDWAGDSSSSTFLIYGNKVSGDGKVLGTYTYTVGSSAIGNLTVTLNNIAVSDTNGDPLSSTSTTNDIIRVISNVNTLSSLTISGATINFSKDVTTYNVEIDSNTTTISATATDSYANVTGTGNKTLKYGSNKFEIIVTSELGTKKTYTINITRPDHRSTDNTLKELKLNNGTISFKSGTTSYNVTVDDSTTIISATANDSKSTIKGTGTKNLNYGVNKFEIVVTAENGSTKTYTLNITRKDNRSTDNNLKELKLNNGTINFKSGTISYNVTVDSNTTTISAVANDSKAKVSGTGTKNLNYGVNTFKIVVTAENESTKIYTLNITRKDNRSSNNNLSSLTLSEGQFTFDKNKINYEIAVDYKVSEIKIEGKVEDTKSKVEGLGTKTLQVGENKFTIKVTAENGSVKEYKIVVIREKEEVVTVNNNIKDLDIEGHKLDFNSNTKDYNITSDKDSLDIKVELESSESTYEIIGNEDLHDGSIIQIIVTDKDGNNNIYTITIENPNENITDEGPNSENNTTDKTDINYVPIIMIIVFTLLLIANIAMRIIKIKKRDNKIN